MPRYTTNYPTAPHFTPAIGAPAYAAGLEALEPAVPLSLYFHIPFCQSLCWFCGCTTNVVRRYQPVAGYVQTLMREIAMVAGQLPARQRVSHIHFGGGSPSMLAGDDWRRLFDSIHGTFDVAEQAEIAVEIDPRNLAHETAQVLGEAGVNRASFGVQDFDPEVQQAINRVQSFEMTARAVESLRAHGIRALNIDLIYGLPKQTRAGIAHSVACVNRLKPDQVALFGYAYVPWFKPQQKLIAVHDLPDGAARLEQFLAAAACFEDAGYHWIGLDHFARPGDGLARASAAGRLKRNFQGYTDDPAGALIGFGASAISSLPHGNMQNASSTPTYLRTIAGGTLAAGRGIHLSAEDILRRAIIERLMCDLSVDLGALCRRHGIPARDFAAELESLDALRRDGMVEINRRRVTVIAPGRPLLRLVCAAFDSYLQQGEVRHSRAV